MTEPLYRRLLGAAFDQLPRRVRELHDLRQTRVWAGRVEVSRGKSAASRAVAVIFRLPPEGSDQPIQVSFEPRSGQEIWTRQFVSAVFRSVQCKKGELLSERVGPSCLLFEPLASAEGLALKLRGVRLLGVPLPAALQPRVYTCESERDGRYRFQVEAHLPVFGLLVRYAGWLVPATSAQ